VGNVRDRIGSWQGGTPGVFFGKLDGFDCHLALYALIPRNAHRAKPACTRGAKRFIPIEYELASRHHAFLLRFSFVLKAMFSP
jgi:hypothetical protein